MRPINRRTSNLIAYTWGMHTGMELSKTVRQNEVYMPSQVKEEAVGYLGVQKKGMQFMEQ